MSRVATIHVVGIAALGLCLSGCVLSEKPLITGATPIGGERFNVTLFRNFANGRAQMVDQRHYAWTAGRYIVTWSQPRGEMHLAAVPLGNDILVQRTDRTETVAIYWLARPIFAGVYYVYPIDENALSAAERKRICAPNQPDDACLVDSYERLQAVAKATARAPMPANPDVAVLSVDVTD